LLGFGGEKTEIQLIRFWISDFGLKKHGAWGMAYALENLLEKFGHDTQTLCAMLYAVYFEP
jgi:hypothetical protein